MYYLQDSNTSIFYHEKAVRLSAEEVKKQYGLDFGANLTDQEKKNPAVNLHDKRNPIIILKGEDFDLTTIQAHNTPKTSLFNIYEFRCFKPYRRVIRLLSCTHENCDKVFRQWHNCFNHLRIHTMEKPFVCKFKDCNRRFNQQTNMKKHLDIHYGVKRFKCDYCERRFFTNFNLYVSTKMNIY